MDAHEEIAIITFQSRLNQLAGVVNPVGIGDSFTLFNIQVIEKFVVDEVVLGQAMQLECVFLTQICNELVPALDLQPGLKLFVIPRERGALARVFDQGVDYGLQFDGGF